MAGHRILIVDDQKEATRIIRSGLDSLEQDFTIEDVLSGEEALLEIKKDINLLIADYRLPGISGLELMEKFTKQHPDIKVILISGVTDPKIRQEVAQAGADAFFFKPIDMADFLDSVERVLGLVETILPTEMEVEREEAIDQEKEATGMTRKITELHQELDATSVFLVGEHGQVLVRSGALPNAEIETALMPTLISAFTAGVKISHFLGQQLPDNLLSFRGENYDLFLAPIGEAYFLLVATKPTLINNTSKIAKAVQATTKAVVMSLDNLGISTQSRGTGSLKSAAPAKEKPKEKKKAEEVKADPELENLLKDAKEVKQTDADAFWESLATEVKPDLGSGDSLSYDQAVQLGLAPSDE
jgi:CheY-like chemotaxis protein